MDIGVDIYKIGVTGSAGSGKSTVCARLNTFGLPVVSSDQLARQAVMPGTSAYQKIVDYFGKTVLTETGLLDRKRMREIITHDTAAKKVLEGFVHPEIFSLMQTEIDDAQKNGHKGVVIEVPLLFELGMEAMFDLIILVSIISELQIKRLMERDQVTAEAASALLAIQMPEEQKIAGSDVVIVNNGSMEAMAQAVDRSYHTWIKAHVR